MTVPFKSEQANALSPKDGSALATIESAFTEKEIYEDRELIVIHLDAAYLRLLDSMEEFQSQWSANPLLAIYMAWEQGKLDGMKEWAADQVDLFKAQTWIDLGEQAKNWAGGIYDRLYSYAIERHRDFAENYSVVTDNPDGTILNWGWWKNVISDKANEAIDAQKKQFEKSIQQINETIDSTNKDIARAQKIYKHREQIFKIPELIAQGDGDAIMAFIRGPLKDIDPELSEQILKNPELHYAVALIRDHDSIMTYLSYVMLAIEAVPPNYFVYIAGRGAYYVILELLLNVVLGILTDGTFTAARIATLTARFAATGARAAKTVRKIEKAALAVQRFNQTINEYQEGCNMLRDLGRKLHFKRTSAKEVRGKTKETLKARQANLKRDPKCKCCGRTDHKSPRTAGNSVLVYR